jgi:16S rRNA (uracil1498-N3)-methyltransferase
MSRFFVSQNEIHSNLIYIKGEDVSHIKKVLRAKCGDPLTVCDGKGKDFEVEIIELGTDYILTSIISSESSKTEPPIDITLFQGIPKSDKMDLIIQKSVELGVNRVVPVITERTVIKIGSTSDGDNKRARWQRIAIEAAKQCNRGVIPCVEAPMSFDRSVELAKVSQVCIIPYEKEEKNSIKNYIFEGAKSVAIMIGPEGGFTEEEIIKATSGGVKPVTLGPRILRTETAGIAVISILMYELGDM